MTSVRFGCNCIDKTCLVYEYRLLGLHDNKRKFLLFNHSSENASQTPSSLEFRVLMVLQRSLLCRLYFCRGLLNFATKPTQSVGFCKVEKT